MARRLRLPVTRQDTHEDFCVSLEDIRHRKSENIAIDMYVDIDMTNTQVLNHSFRCCAATTAMPNNAAVSIHQNTTSPVIDYFSGPR